MRMTAFWKVKGEIKWISNRVYLMEIFRKIERRLWSWRMPNIWNPGKHEYELKVGKYGRV